MFRKVSLILILLSLVSVAQQNNRFKDESKKRKLLKTGTVSFKNIESDGKSEEELINIIKGYNLLFNETPESPQKNKIHLSKISTHLSLSKIYRLKNPQSSKDKELETKFNSESQKLANQLIIKTNLSSEQKSQAFYLLGISFVNQNKLNSARDQFLTSIKLNEKSENTPTLSQFIGQIYFDEEKYKEAVQFFNKYYKRLTNEQKALSLYKTAWAYMNLNQLNESEKLFIRLAKQKKKAPFQEDALRDLAYLMTVTKSEEEIIKLASQIFPKDEDSNIELLEITYEYFQSQSGNKKKPLILNTILNSNVSIERKVKILIANLRGVQREYASQVTITEFDLLNKYLKNNQITKNSKEFKLFSKDLETELLKLIQSFGETYSGKVKTPEKLSKEFIFNKYGSLLLFHIDHFPDSEHLENTIELTLNLYSTSKKFQNLYNISKWAIKRKNSDKLTRIINESLLLSLDELEKKDSKFKPELKILLEKLVQQKNSPNWLNIAKRYSKILTDEKDYKTALIVLKDIDTIEKSDESYYRLQWIRFENELFVEITNDIRNVQNKDFESKVKDISRESYLKIAASSTKEGDFEKYESSILSFLKSTDDKNKRLVAIKDYLQKLINNSNHNKALEFINQLNKEEKFDKEIINFVTMSLDYMVSKGLYKESNSFLQNYKTKALDPYVFMIKVSSQMKLDKSDRVFLNTLTNESKNYYLTLLSIIQPKEVISYFEIHKSVNEAELNLLLFSFQNDQNSFEPILPIWAKKQMFKILPNSLKEDLELTPSEKIIKSMNFPKTTLPENQLSARIQSLIATNTKIRKQVSEDILKYTLKTRIRILKQSEEVENKIYDLIINSPTPKELTEDQLKEYKIKIEEVAKEFKDQAVEYSKISKKLEETLKPKLPSDKWIESIYSNLDSKTKDLYKNLNPLQTQISLDKSLQGQLIAKKDYYSFKIVNILKNKNNISLVNLLKQELESQNENDLLNKLNEELK